MTTPVISTTLQNLKNIDASTVILGFTGSIGSGCTYISEMVPKMGSPRKFKYYKLSDTLREILKLEGGACAPLSLIRHVMRDSL